ncbi:hypothetical protein FGADI_8141 [Fusarium gaditjirri]|uniref:Uncharacterized protein n=1 Tax=Fusarium gaditjirri TaxID=282569 RepID=A0A8H4WU79_9HYPO|nr:hypothetical protein FGADI_8141 [Fusarium gaditjirri]
MAPSKPIHSGRGNSDRDGPRRGRPNHGQEKPAPSVPQPDKAAQAAALRAALARLEVDETTINDGSTPMTGVEGPGSETGPVRGSSRSSRGGFAGRGGRGGSYSARGRTYHNNQTGRYSAASSSKQKDDKSLAVATSSMMTRVADNLTRKATRLVNHTPGGGNSHAFVQLRPGNEVWGVTPGYGVEDEIEALKKKSGCSHVIFQLIAVDDELFKSVSQKAVEKTVEDHEGKNVDGRYALLLRGGVDPQPKQEGEDEEQKCKVCGNPDHTVNACFSRTRKGETFACPLCDTADHTGSTCARIAALSLTEQVKLLITDRGNMPAYFAESRENCWWRLMHKFCMSEEFDLTLVGMVPWSRNFPAKLRKEGTDILELQKQYDGKTGVCMPPDASLESILKIAQKYWDNDGLPWPVVNLGQRPVPPGRNQDGDQTMEGAAPAAEPAPAPAPAEAEAEAPAAVYTAPAEIVSEPAAAPATAPTTFSFAAPATTAAPFFFGPARDDMFGDGGEAGEIRGREPEDEISYSDDENV